MKWKLEFDGGATPNPGCASCAFIATDETGRRISKAWKIDRKATNNEAEWEALTVGVETIFSVDPDVSHLFITGDSELIIMQLSGAYRVKSPKLVPYYNRARELLKTVSARIVHRPREENAELDTLCKSVRRSE